MVKGRYSIFINDDCLYLLDNKNNKIYEEILSNLSQDEIINEEKFYFSFNSFIRKNKIKIPLFGHKLQFIINDKLNPIQKNKYKEIFLDYFRKVDFININEILSLSRSTILVNITNNYIDFYYYKKNTISLLRIDKNIFNNNEFKVIIHFLNTIFNPKKIILFGTNEIIPKLTQKINKEIGIQCTYQEEYSKYILTEIQKKIN